MIINKFHAPIKDNLNFLEKQINDGAKVLEIGPGYDHFSKATHFCGWTKEESSRLKNYSVVDVSSEKLPYQDNEFDFVYCRHVIEDLWNPINCLNEISRVGKAGYIETPSPVCEMSKDVDAGKNIPYRGYNHHRYFVWNDNGVLNILPKFPIIEYMKFDENQLQNLLQHPFNWCTFYSFKDKINYKLNQMGREQDFVMFNDSYINLIKSGMMKGLLESKKRYDVCMETPIKSQKDVTVSHLK